MKYNYSFEIKYQEVDGKRRVRLFNLENYLLEVAGRVADELGFGIAALYPMGLTWILTRVSLEMNELPTHCDKIRFETWIESNVHMLSTRDFRIYSGDKLIGICKSVWAVLDLQKREIVNCFDLPIFHDCVDGEFLNLDRIRMSAVMNPTGVVPHTVVYSDIDYNGHCNSCRYLQAMTDAYLPDYYGKTVRVDINYTKEAMLGETMETHYQVLPDGVQYQQKNEGAQTCCSCKITISDPA